MQRHAIPVFLPTLLLALSPALSLAATPSFTISATNTTMSSNGSGSIPIALTSVDGYAGQVGIVCGQPSVPAGTLLPVCGGGPALALTVTADATVKGTIGLTTGPVPLAASRLHRPNRGGVTAWALAGVLLLGIGFHRRRTRWLPMLLLSVGLLAGFAGLGACAGSGPPTLTPGTYAYTVTATDMNTNATASTTVEVTVPPGIPANGM